MKKPTIPSLFCTRQESYSALRQERDEKTMGEERLAPDAVYDPLPGFFPTGRFGVFHVTWECAPPNSHFAAPLGRSTRE